MLTTTVIVPTYNRADYLRVCLDSILAQTRPADQIIVINDGSTDDTESVARSFGPRVRYLKQENAGKSTALNHALDHAEGSHVWIMDDDDIACADALETLSGLLENDPSADFAYGRHIRFVDDPDSGDRRFLDTGYWRDCPPAAFLVATLEDFFAHQPGLLVSRALYEKAGRFDATLKRSQDYKMLIALARHGEAASTSDVVFWQRQHQGARGPVGQRFEASEANAKWIEADRRIFSEVHRDFALEEYLPGAPAEMDPRDRRRALLTRGSIMARKKLWDLAIPDFHAAAELDLGPLDDGEIATVRQAFAAKFGASDVLSDAAFQPLLAHQPGRWRDMPRIRAALATGLRWRVREALGQGRIGEALGYASLMMRLRFARQPNSPENPDRFAGVQNRQGQIPMLQSMRRATVFRSGESGSVADAAREGHKPLRLGYLAHDVADPAVGRRMDMLAAGGAQPDLVGFLRNDITVESTAGRPSAEILARTRDSRLVDRALAVLRVRATRIAALADRFDGAQALIARNLEMLIIAVAVRRKLTAMGGTPPRIVYECLDIHRLLTGDTLAARLVQAVEARLAGEVDLVITSSPAFVTHHLGRVFDAPVHLVENKVPAFRPDATPPAPATSAGPPWRIGWFGMLRCRRSFALLAALSRQAGGMVQVVLRGRPSPAEFPDFEAAVAAEPYMTFEGPYRGSTELAAIYSDVHFAWCIDFFEQGANSTWLLPNRMYESAYHRTVPLALATVETGRRLRALGTGIVFESESGIDASFFAEMSADSYRTHIERLQDQPPSTWAADMTACRDLVAAILGEGHAGEGQDAGPLRMQRPSEATPALQVR